MATNRISWRSPAPTTDFYLDADIVGQEGYGAGAGYGRWLMHVYLVAVNRGSTGSFDSGSGQQIAYYEGSEIYRHTSTLPSGYATNQTRWTDGPVAFWINANSEGRTPEGDDLLSQFWMRVLWPSFDSGVLAANISFPRIAQPPDPCIPFVATPDQITATSMRYQFNGPADDGGSGIIRWEYQYSTSPTFASGNSAVIASSGTSIATGLTPRTTYYFRSRGVNAVGNAAWSSIKSATTLDVPDAPDLSIASYNSNSVTLNLTDPAYTGGGITGRLIEASTSPTFDTIAGSDTASPWTITGLARGTFYYLRARVTNSFGNSSYDTTGFTTDLDAPSTPTGYAAHDIASRTAWSYMGTIVDNGGAALSQLNYQINTSASATGATDVTLDTAREPMFSALVPGTTYYYRLRVKNPQTWSAWGAWVSFVAKTNVPHEPTALATSAVGSTTVTLGWTDPVTLLGSTITGHRVVIGTNKALTTGVQTADTGAAELSRVFTGLTPGTVYYARVYTLSSNGDGSSTGLITFTTAGGGSVPDLLWENVGGVWKQITLWENVAGVWKQITLWENVSGTWENGL